MVDSWLRRMYRLQTSMSIWGTGSQMIHRFLVFAIRSFAEPASRDYLRMINQKYEIWIFHGRSCARLTSPFSHEWVDVHEKCQQLMWLTKSWLVAVECYHDCALERLVRKFPFATRHQRFMCGRVENRMINIALLVDVHQFVVSDVLILH